VRQADDPSAYDTGMIEIATNTTKGGASDFSRVIAVCESFGPYCLIGGLAVNCFVEPVYSVQAEIVIADMPPALDLNSALDIQFIADDRYQAFVNRAETREVLEVQTRVACLADVAQGKLWAYSDPKRRLSKRKKDELDLILLAEAHPELTSLSPRLSCRSYSPADDGATSAFPGRVEPHDEGIAVNPIERRSSNIELACGVESNGISPSTPLLIGVWADVVGKQQGGPGRIQLCYKSGKASGRRR
jgi:hypothetical protein